MVRAGADVEMDKTVQRESKQLIDGRALITNGQLQTDILTVSGYFV